MAEKLHAFSCAKTIAGEPTCKQWCGRPDRCLSTLTYPEDYMQTAYERGLRDGLERAAKIDDADRGSLAAQLAECLREREVRQKRGCGYGKSVSDQWLERDIAALQRALADVDFDRNGAPAEQWGKLADAFERSADWLDHGTLSGTPRTHPLVGTGDYRLACAGLRMLAEKLNSTDGVKAHCQHTPLPSDAPKG